MNDTLLKVKQYVAERLDRDGATFRFLKRIYISYYSWSGRRAVATPEGIRRLVASSEGVSAITTEGKDMVAEFRDGSRFVYDPGDTTDLLSVIVNVLKGKFEEPDKAFCEKVIHKDDVVFDVGANFGWYTILFSKLVGPQGKVYSFEPIPKEQVLLSRNIALNAASNVTLGRYVVGAEEKAEVPLYIPVAYGPAYASVIPDHAHDAKHSRTVMAQMTTLDAYVRKHNIKKVDFIKCDVEGYETPVFEGAKKLIAEFKPIVLAEVSRFKTDQRAFEIFIERGYEIFHYSGSALIPVTHLDGDMPPVSNFLFIHKDRRAAMKI